VTQERRFRVLLADDNFDMREYVTKLLSERYDVCTASNGMDTPSSSSSVVSLSGRWLLF
jgi:CheY-like chemotaxis protein